MSFILDTASVIATFVELRQKGSVTYSELIEQLMRASDHNQRVCEIAVRAARDEGYLWLGRNAPVMLSGAGRKLVYGVVESVAGPGVELQLGNEFGTTKLRHW